MPRKQSKAIKDDHGWTVVIDSIIAHAGRPDGDGWKSVKELHTSAELNPSGVSLNGIQKMMEDYIRQEIVERRSGTSNNGKRCFYYRPIRN